MITDQLNELIEYCICHVNGTVDWRPDHSYMMEFPYPIKTRLLGNEQKIFLSSLKRKLDETAACNEWDGRVYMEYRIKEGSGDQIVRIGLIPKPINLMLERLLLAMLNSEVLWP